MRCLDAVFYTRSTIHFGTLWMEYFILEVVYTLANCIYTSSRNCCIYYATQRTQDAVTMVKLGKIDASTI